MTAFQDFSGVKCAGVATFSVWPNESKESSSSASCFLISNALYVCYRTKSRISKKVYRSCVI